jgi:3-dehydroquinate dehydratase II
VKERIVVINGPNLNLLGERDPDQYGSCTLQEINGMMTETAVRLGVEIAFFQSNHEGDLIDILHDERRKAAGFIMNPGALTHYSYALRDAIDAVVSPVAEVHISDIGSREEWRRVSVIREVVMFSISGEGPQGYVRALERIVENIRQGA